jgi:hypothetical protein
MMWLFVGDLMMLDFRRQIQVVLEKYSAHEPTRFSEPALPALPAALL